MYKIVLAFMLVPSLAFSMDLYKCKRENGTTEFSQTPCARNAEKSTINIPARSSNLSDQEWCINGPASVDLIAECVDAWRPILRDPRGAYADSGMLVHRQSNGKLAVFLDGHAKNGFGGTNAMFMQCELDASGRINSAGTKELIKLREAFFELKVEPTPPRMVVCKTLQHNNQ